MGPTNRAITKTSSIAIPEAKRTAAEIQIDACDTGHSPNNAQTKPHATGKISTKAGKERKTVKSLRYVCVRAMNRYRGADIVLDLFALQYLSRANRMSLSCGMWDVGCGIYRQLSHQSPRSNLYLSLFFHYLAVKCSHDLKLEMKGTGNNSSTNECINGTSMIKCYVVRVVYIVRDADGSFERSTTVYNSIAAKSSSNSLRLLVVGRKVPTIL